MEAINAFNLKECNNQVCILEENPGGQVGVDSGREEWEQGDPWRQATEVSRKETAMTWA